MKNRVRIGLVVVVVLLAAWLVWLNNHLVALHENVPAAWGQVETVLQRRFDLIPNLVSTVKGYVQHEKGVLEELTRLRSQWAGARTVDEKVKAAGELEGGLARLLMVAERYPDLKASSNFRDLQYELAGTENRIAVERQRYNDAVRAYNTGVRQFPANLLAPLHRYSADGVYFEAAGDAKALPKVDFGTPKDSESGAASRPS